MGQKEPERNKSTEETLQSAMGISFLIIAQRTLQLTLPVGSRPQFEYTSVPWLLFPPLLLEKYFGSCWTQATECNRTFVWFSITLMNKDATQSSHSSISGSNL